MSTHMNARTDHAARSDDHVRRDVVAELAWDSRLSGAPVTVAVDDGIVTLTGVVECYAKKYAADEAAHRIAGVQDVANDLEVRVPYADVRSDTDIARAVRHALEWDVMVPDERIQSTVSDGFVTLDGTVDLLRQREDAAAAVRQLTGVRGVANRIRVAPPTITADDVEHTIQEVLARRAHREASGIEVTVRDGVVSLAGPVRSWAERQAVLGAVGHARGITAVDNRIRIDPYD